MRALLPENNLYKITKYFSGKSLKSLAVRGSLWLGMASGTEQILRLIRNMILARLLVPEAFGLKWF
jgi:O-antigen/teichoic acid export membrane protein